MSSQNKKQVKLASTAISLLVICSLLLPVLGWSQDDQVDKLIKNLKDEDWSVRWSAAMALGKLKLKNARAVEPLIVALKDENELVRGSAAEALGELKNARAVGPLIATLKDEKEATWALVKIGTPAVAPLIAALKDKTAARQWQRIFFIVAI